MYVQCTCIMEFSTSRTFSAVRNTPTSDKSKCMPSITIGLTFLCAHLMCYGYNVLTGDWMIRSEAFSCLNDSFRTIQMVEWFIQDHSVAWMIHSGPFSCLNDSFRLLNKNWTFAQQVPCCWITSMYSSEQATVQANFYPLKNCSGAFTCLDDSFRTIQVLEWFIQEH